MTRWRQRLGEEQLVALIQESLAVATRTGAVDALNRSLLAGFLPVGFAKSLWPVMPPS